MIKRIAIENYRSLAKVEMNCGPRLNVVIGENNSGKTAIFSAIDSLLVETTQGSQAFEDDDRRNGDATATLRVSIDVLVRPSEASAIAGDFAVRGVPSDFVNALARIGAAQVEFVWGPQAGRVATISLGSVLVKRGGFTLRTPGAVPWGPSGAWDPLTQAGQALGVQQRLRRFAESRQRPISTGRSATLESFGGSDTASAIYNLKNSTDRGVRRRYDKLREEFRNLSGGLEFESVDLNGTPDLHFFDGDGDYPIKLNRMGAGFGQLLTMLTNIYARANFMLVFDEPELHLHVHARRQLRDLIQRASTENQIFIVTHDPLFAWPSQVDFVTRLARTAAGVHAFQLGADVVGKERGQIETALKDIGNRELLFARAVLLVEDESIRNVSVGFAKTLGLKLDALSISVIAVGGQDGFRPYEAILNALQVPYVCLKDQPWCGDRTPPKYWSWNAKIELEEYLDAQGLAEYRTRGIQEVGQSKQRVATWLGQNVPAELIPGIFPQVLEAVRNQAVLIGRK